MSDPGRSYPKDWTTTMSVRAHAGSVLEVKWSLPEIGSRSNFSRYKVFLFNDDTDTDDTNRNNAFKEQVVSFPVCAF
jgi:hypothetical protein